jgi:type II secretory pathway pseudopilin PulG
MLLNISLLTALSKLPHKVLDIRQQYGSTLIEVLAAIVIMAVVSLSMINLFTCGTLFVATASQDINALNRAQEVLEEIKAIKNSQRGFALGGDNNAYPDIKSRKCRSPCPSYRKCGGCQLIPLWKKWL